MSVFLRQANGIPLEVFAPAASACTFALSDSATAILRLAAAHDGVSATSLLTRLICQHAERVGLPGLLDAGDTNACPLTKVRQPLSRGEPILSPRGEEGDLHAVPDFERAGNRFKTRSNDHA